MHATLAWQRTLQPARIPRYLTRGAHACMLPRAAALLFIQIVLSAWAESKRFADFKNPGSQGDGSFFGITDDLKGVANGYPGGKLFDPFGLSRGSDAQFEKYKVRRPSQVPRHPMQTLHAMHDQGALTGGHICRCVHAPLPCCEAQLEGH